MGNLLTGEILYFREDVFPDRKDIPVKIEQIRVAYSGNGNANISILDPIDGHDWWFGQAGEFEE